MAKRPWVTPQEVREYSETTDVQNRSDARLAVDITRAEQYVITYAHNDFEEYEVIPLQVKAAVLILAEAYAHNTVTIAKEVKSETFDDYSYTAESTSISVDSLNLSALLDEYVISQPNNGVILRMRKL